MPRSAYYNAALFRSMFLVLTFMNFLTRAMANDSDIGVDATTSTTADNERPVCTSEITKNGICKGSLYLLRVSEKGDGCENNSNAALNFVSYLLELWNNADAAKGRYGWYGNGTVVEVQRCGCVGLFKRAGDPKNELVENIFTDACNNLGNNDLDPIKVFIILLGVIVGIALLYCFGSLASDFFKMRRSENDLRTLLLSNNGNTPNNLKEEEAGGDKMGGEHNRVFRNREKTMKKAEKKHEAVENFPTL